MKLKGTHTRAYNVKIQITKTISQYFNRNSFFFKLIHYFLEKSNDSKKIISIDFRMANS